MNPQSVFALQQIILADVIDTGQLVAVKSHKTAIDTDSVTLQPQSSYWHRNF